MSKCYKCGEQWTNENRVETPLLCPKCELAPTMKTMTYDAAVIAGAAHGSANYRDMWAVVFPDGHIVTGSDLKTEDDAWRIALGWPGPEEIEDAKHRGVFSVKARLRYYSPND